MKLTHLAIANYQRLTQVDLPINAPLLLVAGPNEQGKTSLADAVYHACTGVARRVKLKKDYQSLVHDGQKSGIVAITVAGDGENRDITLKIPQDKRAGDADLSGLLPYLLDQKMFFRVDPDERRKVLFSVTGTRITGKTILEELKKKGANAKKTTEIGATLLAGFEAAADEAKRKATEARGAWKALTGENYGSEKAKSWEAQRPTFDADLIVRLAKDIEKAEAQERDLVGKKATMDEQKRAFREREQQKVALQERAADLERAEAKLAVDQKDVDEWTDKVADTKAKAEGKAAVEPLTCPHCAGLVDLKDGKLHEHVAPDKVADPKAKAMLAGYEESLRKVTSFRDNDQTRVDNAKAAKVTLAELEKTPLTPVDIAEYQRIENELDVCQKHLKVLRASLSEQNTNKVKAERASTDTNNALQHHTDVAEWSEIADWLAPSGIQSELLKSAMNPFNTRLAGTAALTGWDQVTIDGDMTVRVGGRPYSLASASAQWRAEAAITEAIAWVSGVKTFMLDEVEILVGPNRLAFLKWMHTLAANGNVDTAILIGSFKEPPQCPPTFQVEWLEKGFLVHESAETAEAA